MVRFRWPQAKLCTLHKYRLQFHEMRSSPPLASPPLTIIPIFGSISSMAQGVSNLIISMLCYAIPAPNEDILIICFVEETG